MAQDIWYKLLSHRVVERFDPAKVHGASERRYHYYLKLCLVRMNHTRWKVASKEPDTDGLSMTPDDEEYGLSSEEWLHQHRAQPVLTPHVDDQIYMQEFRNFVSSEEPKLVTVIDALVENRSAHRETAEDIGATLSQFRYQLARLRKLAKEFTA
jgi:hypothetical protein